MFLGVTKKYELRVSFKLTFYNILKKGQVMEDAMKKFQLIKTSCVLCIVIC